MIIGRKQIKKIALVFCILLGFVFSFNYIMQNRISVSAKTPTEIDTIVIDAGHGGFDGGAVGYNGLVEKHINLEIAKKLQQVLVLCGYNTVMTRTTDADLCDNEQEVAAVFIKKNDMRKRLEIMDNTKNSITVSIHQNKYESEAISGAQVYYGVKNDMSKTLAQSVQNAIVSSVQNDNKRQIKQAQKDLFLLYYTNAPAIIVECGFISNPKEAANLSDNEYQNKIALAIVKGITDFKKQ